MGEGGGYLMSGFGTQRATGVQWRTSVWPLSAALEEVGPASNLRFGWAGDGADSRPGNVVLAQQC